MMSPDFENGLGFVAKCTGAFRRETQLIGVRLSLSGRRRQIQSPDPETTGRPFCSGLQIYVDRHLARFSSQKCLKHRANAGVCYFQAPQGRAWICYTSRLFFMPFPLFHHLSRRNPWPKSK
ncbi:MAG TPA: hypothetical protein VF928_15755 [Usitatibacteraceae bacterium]